MTPESYPRKLAAILSADVKGYSLLMAHDELATVQTLTAYRKIMAGIIQGFQGSGSGFTRRQSARRIRQRGGCGGVCSADPR